MKLHMDITNFNPSSIQARPQPELNTLQIKKKNANTLNENIFTTFPQDMQALRNTTNTTNEKYQIQTCTAISTTETVSRGH